MPEKIRLLTPSDIPAAMRLKAAADWNQTSEDWRRYIDLEPEGCFGIEAGGELAATAGCIRYGSRLSWIGMVLTLPEFRGRGYAASLMEACIELLERRGVEWIKLDATAQGRPIYARLGFEDECAIERWVRPPGLAPFASVDRFEFDFALDFAAFGADRGVLLKELSRIASVSVAGQGYAMTRPGSEADYFGPCVSRSPEPVERMIAWAIRETAPRPLCWDLLPSNEEAVRLARAMGFERRRELVRMVRRGASGAEPIRAGNPLVYAIAGFEYG